MLWCLGNPLQQRENFFLTHDLNRRTCFRQSFRPFGVSFGGWAHAVVWGSALIARDCPAPGLPATLVRDPLGSQVVRASCIIVRRLRGAYDRIKQKVTSAIWQAYKFFEAYIRISKTRPGILLPSPGHHPFQRLPFFI